jgi:hypothetical protein
MMLFLVAYSKAIKYVTVAYRQSVLLRVFVRRLLQFCSPHERQFDVEMANSLTVSGRMSTTIVWDGETPNQIEVDYILSPWIVNMSDSDSGGSSSTRLSGFKGGVNDSYPHYRIE